jgi:hypothetical protein
MERSDALARKAVPFSPIIAPTYSLADRMLAGHEKTFTIKFMGKRYPLWKLVEHLCHITNKDDQDVLFKYNYQQCLLYLAKCKMKEAGKQVRVDILKARQIGFSTEEDVEDSLFALFTPNVRIGILADTIDHASGLFEKIQYVYDHLDMANPNRDLIESDPKKYGYLSYKPKLRYNKGQTLLQTEYGHSRVEVMCVSDTAGRSKHYTKLHCSEVAFWDCMEKTFTSLFKTISRHNPNSSIVLETTANGFNDYKARWDSDYAGSDVSFFAFFAPWFENPEYKEPIPLGFDLQASMDQWEKDKQKLHNLTDEQMYWFHLEYLDSQRNKDSVLQEDPFDPVDPFISTGNAVFDKDLLAERKREIVKEQEEKKYALGIFTCDHIANADQSRIEIPSKSIVFHSSHDGFIKVFENPIKGHPYVVTCDPNMGGSDDVAMQVVDNYTGVQVARFKTNKLANDLCAYQLYCLGYAYNWALISSETNVGQIVMEILVRCNYPHIYVTQAQNYQNANRVVSPVFGHKTTVANRQYMIDMFVKAFRENPKMIRDYDTICEMESFQLVEHTDKEGNVTRSKQEAAGGSHDDLVMAFAAFYIVRSQQTAIPQSVDEDDKDDHVETIADINHRILEERRAATTRKEIVNRSVGISW